jgi:steroid 5-alpha reductase family enzyme
MSFINIYLQTLVLILIMMSFIWIVSVFLKNVSIVDIFWGFGFVVAATFYFLKSGGNESRKILILSLSVIWGLRLTLYLAWRNYGKGEDYRYREFRKKYGEARYWWISYFQTFLLQGVLMWLISAPLLGAQYYGHDKPPGILDYAVSFSG